jgi:hypothetical protein
MRRSRVAVVALSAAIASLAASPAPTPAAAAGELSLGFLDGQHFFGAGDPPGSWLRRARSVNAQIVRINLIWSGVAPQRPPDGSAAADPAWSGYHWSAMDSAVRAASARGLRPLLTFVSAPTWAEGAGRRAGAPPGTWRPDPRALEAFATAAARRYSGTFSDPARPGQALPRVDAWQAWNEPNLSTYLTPQWTSGNPMAKPSSPGWYRGMLNAVYSGVHSGQPSPTIVSAGTAPYGDLPGGLRMMPALFTREFLCLRGRSLRRIACPNPAQFDVLAHHPYSIAGPYRHALNGDDVGIPDLRRLTRPLRAAERSGRALPAGRKALWITEISWDSSPPDPQGVPIQRHAMWLQEALSVLWHQGARVVVWLGIGDQAPVPSYSATYQSGVFFRNGKPKPAARAFRFPFVTRCTRRSCTAWGRTPSPGATVVIERRTSGRWVRIGSLASNGSGVFEGSIRNARHATLRARSAGERSLARRQR